MCEPYGSVIQYPVQDDMGRSVKQMLEPVVALDVESKVVESTVLVPERPRLIIPQGIIIGSHVHYAKAGKGHSETLRKLGLGHLRLPDDTKYEISWWNREFKVDGGYQTDDPQDAYESGRIYAERFATGHIQMLRRFLESTLKNTDTPMLYFSKFRNLLTRSGWMIFEDKLSYILGNKGRTLDSRTLANKTYLSQVTNAIVGLTRKRKLLVPEWADDGKLWT